MKINFLNPPWIYLSDFQKVSVLQRMILVHSYLYYEEDESVISDKDFDELSKQLVEMQNWFDENELKTKTDYGYVFIGFDGTTGFDLYDKLNSYDKTWIGLIAINVLESYRRETR